MSSAIDDGMRRIYTAGLSPGSVTEEVCRGVLAMLESDRSVRTYADDLASLVQYCRHRRSLGGPLDANRSDLQEYLSWLRPHYAPDSLRRMLSVARVFYREAIERGAYVGPNPAERLGKIKAQSEPGERALTRKEAESLLELAAIKTNAINAADALRARRDYALLMTALLLGLRASEIVALRPGDVRDENGIPALAIRGKGGSFTLMKVPPDVLHALSAWRTALAAAGVVLTNRDPYFIPLGRRWPPAPRRNANNGRISSLSRRTLWDIVDEYLAQINRKGHRSGPHLLRRTSVTLVWEGSHDLLLAQRHARHRLPATTEAHYIKPLVDLEDSGVDYIHLSPRHPASFEDKTTRADDHNDNT